MLRVAFQEHLHGPLDQSIERPFFLVLCVLVEVRSGVGYRVFEERGARKMCCQGYG